MRSIARLLTTTKTYPETGQTLLPRAHARLPDEIEHLPIVVDVVAIVGDGERERNGRMGFSHVGGRLWTTRRRGVSVSAVVGAAPVRTAKINKPSTGINILSNSNAQPHIIPD